MGDFDSQMEALSNQLERQAERDAERAEAHKRDISPVLSPEERARLAAAHDKRKGLELTRANLQAQIHGATSERFREHLTRALEAIETQIAALEE
jgi:hypothetical protein